MWVRKIGRKGNVLGVTLPQEALRALGWERGDHLIIYLHNEGSLLATRFDPEKRPDLLAAARTSEEQAGNKLSTIKA